MTNDGAEWWWSNSDRGPYDDQQSGGTMCYVNGGVRHSKGAWPAAGDQDPLFAPPCDSGF